MAIFRVNKSKDYTVMCNYHLRDKSISLKAKGLLSQMLSLPDGWDYSIEGLVKMNLEEKTAIVSALKELKNAGYVDIVKRTPDQTASGRYEYIYDIFELPKTKRDEKQDIEIQGIEKQGIEILDLEIQALENQPQLNTNKEILNNKILNNKILKENRRFTPPALEEVRAYCEERNNNIDPAAFIDHYTANGWKVGGRSQMKDWRAAVRQWERNDIQAGRKKTPKPMDNKSYDLEEVEKFW